MAGSPVHIPGYAVGDWDIDPDHSGVSFVARHMMVSKVRGNFHEFTGEIVTAENPLESSCTASIDVTSLETGSDERDEYLRSADLFEAGAYPSMEYSCTGIRAEGNRFRADGELTIKGVTRPVPLRLEVNGFDPDGPCGRRARFTATTEINRKDFGVTFSAMADGLVGDRIRIDLQIEAVLRQRSA
jgi:polyisoprenoid-binding protein YceI